ncbi:MAG: hypothetical protein L7V86_01555 [Verrucomicrobiales bacterium]|nr:hypothetical protein [Verrucomicrobiales bacterium]
MKSLLLVLLSSVFVFSASDSFGKDTLKRNLAYEDLQVGHWYNFYFLKGHSSFAKATVECKRAKTSVNVHAAKVVSKKSKSEVTITFQRAWTIIYRTCLREPRMRKRQAQRPLKASTSRNGNGQSTNGRLFSLISRTP